MRNLIDSQYNWVGMLTEAVALMNSGEISKLYKAYKLLKVILGLPDDGTKNCRSVKGKAAAKLALIYAAGLDCADGGYEEEADPCCEVEQDIVKAYDLLLQGRRYGSAECENLLAELYAVIADYRHASGRGPEGNSVEPAETARETLEEMVENGAISAATDWRSQSVGIVLRERKRHRTS